MRCALLDPTRKARAETEAAPQRRSWLQGRDSEVLDALEDVGGLGTTANSSTNCRYNCRRLAKDGGGQRLCVLCGLSWQLCGLL